jgi:protein gp37
VSPTKIAWTSETWNPTVGCSRVSPGCTRCYAVDVAHRQLQDAHVGLTIRRDGERPDWTGEVRCLPDRLTIPVRWQTPRRVFVDSMSDLFHPKIPLGFFAEVWDVMVVTPIHTYQILTKRPQRIARTLGPDGIGFYAVEGAVPCPQPNIWLGTSIESDSFTRRAEALRTSPAAIRFLSLEPLLGPLPSLDLTGIDWVIVGGESGNGARPMHPDWARDIRDRCTRAGIPFFFKQWGAWAPDSTPGIDQRAPSIWVESSRGGEECMLRVGSKNSGHELDGRAWREFPAAAS